MESNSHVPDSWRRVPLKDVAHVVMGQSPPGDTVTDWNGEGDSSDGLPFTQGNAEFGAKFPQPVKWCSAPAKIARPGDTLISVRAPVGDTNRADRMLSIGRGLAAVRFTGIDPSYGWHVLNETKRGLERIAQGSTFEAIGSNDLLTLGLLVPSIEEQRAIAAILDSIDEAIERTEEVIAATKRLRDALLHDLLTRGLPGRHTEFKQVRGLGTIPAGWDVARLGDVCERPEYGASAPARPYDPVLPRYVRITDITDDGRLKMDDLRSAEPEKVQGYELQDGDLLFARSGSVGRTYRYTSKDGPCVYAGYLIRFRALRELVLPEFLELCTRSGFYHKWVESILRQGAQPNINAAEYASLRIPLPSLDEQDHISHSIACLTNSIGDSRRATHVLRVTKTSISHQLLKGELRLSGNRFRKEGIER